MRPTTFATGLWRKRRARGLLAVFSLFLTLFLVAAPAVALAARSGGSFGGRTGFRSGGGFSSAPRSYSRGGGYSSGPSFFFFPSFGYGGYGFGGFGSIVVLAVLGIAAFQVVRAVRRHQQATGGGWGSYDDGEDEVAMPAGRAYVYRLQVGLGRSARGIQERLARFAAEGDTGTGAGLVSLLQQTVLEVLREKDSIRYGGAEGSGPMSLPHAETKMNGMALGERSRFQVERVRGADGQVRRSQAAAEEGKEALEYVLVTLIVATRLPLDGWKKPISERTEVERVLGQLGGLSADVLLGMEVVWTPADPNDSMTETDLMTTYPELRSL
jgi:uncharacterized membrane protein